MFQQLDDIIRYGSKELFTDESEGPGKARQIHYDDGAIDRLLKRDEIDADEASVDDEDDDLLKAFKVANFEYIDEVEAAAARAEEAMKLSMAENGFTSNDRAIYWEVLLGDKYEVIQIEESTMGKGKRNRKQMSATEEGDGAETGSEDEDYSYEDDLSDTDICLPGQASGKRGQISRKRCRVDFNEPRSLMEGEGKSFRVRGFNQNQRAAFLQLVMRFGFGKYDWKEFVPRLKGKSLQEVNDYGRLFMEHLTEELNDSPTFSDGVPKDSVRIEDVLVRLGTIQTIEEKLNFLSECPRAPLFQEVIHAWFPGLKGRIWREEHDILLLKAILKHGYARWQSMVEDQDLGLAEIVRQEMNLPVINGPFVGMGNQTADCANTGSSANGSSEAPNSNQSNPDYTMLNQFREVQRRIVDFIRKRYHLLDKAMNAELLRERHGGTKPNEYSKNSDMSPKADFLSPERSSLSEIFPMMDPIAVPEPACDDKSRRLEMIGLYNGMCRVVEDNRPDALQAYFGVSSASSRLSKNISDFDTIYEDVRRVLTVPDQVSSMEVLDVESVKGSEVINGGLLITSESDPKLTAAVEKEAVGSEVDEEEIILPEDA